MCIDERFCIFIGVLQIYLIYILYYFKNQNN